MQSLRTWTAGLVALTGLVALSGCGAGAGLLASQLLPKEPKAPKQANAPSTFNIDWGARSRGISAPSSALSVVVRLASGKELGETVEATINRQADPAAYTQMVTLPKKASVGDNSLEIDFKSLPEGGGDTVGRIRAQVVINEDGSGIGDIATEGAVAFMEIGADQSVRVGQKIDLFYQAKDLGGQEIAVSPGSVFFSITSGGEFLRIGSDGKAEGLAPGTATVTATVDGKTSAPVNVTVTVSGG